MVGKKMTIGVKDEFRVYLKGDTPPLSYSTLLQSEVREKEPAIPWPDLDFLKSRETLTSAHDGIPASGKRYVV